MKSLQTYNNRSYANCVIYQMNHKKLKISLTFDMWWQNKSSYRRYDSYIRHAFTIIVIYKGIIGMVMHFNTHQKCDAVYNRGEET